MRITAKLKQADVDSLVDSDTRGYTDKLCHNLFWKLLTLTATFKVTELQLRTEINDLVRRLQENKQFDSNYEKTKDFVCSNQNVLYGFYFNYTFGLDGLKINVR